MKGGLAVLLTLAEALAADPTQARFDATLVFYEGEEVADELNGLRRLFAERPDLRRRRPRGAARADRRVGRGRLPGHAARAGDVPRRPGPLRPAVDGRNAIHRAADVLARLAAHEADTVDVDGLRVPGVAPGRADRGRDRQQRGARRVRARREPPLRPGVLGRRGPGPGRGAARRAPTRSRWSTRRRPRRRTSRTRWSPSSSARSTSAVRPKLGWTDVARFAAHGIPALQLRARRSRDRAHRGRARRPASRSTVATRCSVGSSASPDVAAGRPQSRRSTVTTLP